MKRNLDTRKRYKRVRRRVILIILFIVIFVDIFLLFKKPWIQDDYVAQKPKSDYVLPVNYKISNTMSSIDGTKGFDRTVNRFLSKWAIKGASFAIMKNGQLLYAKGYGYADSEQKIRSEVKHLFRTASVSKLITAVAIMKLKEEGKLNLSDSVFGKKGILNDSMFLDIRDKRVETITIEHLLRHRAGFSLRVGDPMFKPAIVANTLGVPQPLSMNDMVQYSAESILRTKPGTSGQYSNIGYLVLSKVIEKISGMEYETYVKTKILNPIGCYDMYIGENRATDKRINEVTYYESHDAEPIISYDGTGRYMKRSDGGNDVYGLYGAGAWIASPVELLKFISAIENSGHKKKILSRESVEYMTQFTEDVSPIGWAKVTEDDEWIRTGTLAGTSALIKHQNNGYTWVFITNTSSWRGAGFTRIIENEIGDALNKIRNVFPKRDLFESQPITPKIDSLNLLHISDLYCF